MKKIYIAILVISSLSIFSCKEIEPSIMHSNGLDMIITTKEAANNSFWKLQSKEKSLISPLKNDYSFLFAPCSDIVTISSLHTGNKTNDIQYSYANFHVKHGDQTRAATEPRKYNIYIDGELMDREKTRSSKDEKPLDLSHLYGKKVKIAFKSTEKTRSGSEEEDTPEPEIDTLYIPQQIEIATPQSPDGHTPLCYYKDFIVRWNPDIENRYGVLVSVEWFGTMMYGLDHPNIYYRTVDHIEEDTGCMTLNKEMFKDIPDTALCYLTIARGTVQNTTVNEETTYKVLAETHATIPFILIKYIEDNDNSVEDGTITETDGPEEDRP